MAEYTIQIKDSEEAYQFEKHLDDLVYSDNDVLKEIARRDRGENYHSLYWSKEFDVPGDTEYGTKTDVKIAGEHLQYYTKQYPRRDVEQAELWEAEQKRKSEVDI